MADAPPVLKRFDLTGRRALVTGAGRGLGQGMALALAQAGASVALVSRSEEQLLESQRLISTYSGKAVVVPWDLQDAASMSELVTTVSEKLGEVDILVHAAGIQVRKTALELTPNEWDDVHNIHLKTAHFLSSAFAKRLRDADRPGSIILLASLTSKLGVPETVAYSAAKSGVLGLVRTLAVEWACNGIRVNAIGPGYFHTQLTDRLFRNAERREWLLSRIPLGRTGEADDLAGATVFLASQASSYVTGQVIFVDGGWLAG